MNNDFKGMTQVDGSLPRMNKWALKMGKKGLGSFIK